MKFTVNVECTPDEARAFMGLPDVRPMQEAFMDDVQQRMKSNLAAMDPESLMKTWLPAGLQGAEQMQKMFWSQMQQAFSGMMSGANTLAGFGERSKD